MSLIAKLMLIGSISLIIIVVFQIWCMYQDMKDDGYLGGDINE